MKIKCPEAQIGKCDNKKCQDYYWHEEYEACGDVCPKRPSKDTVLYTDYVDFHTTIISFKEYERRIEQAKQILAWGKTI